MATVLRCTALLQLRKSNFYLSYMVHAHLITDLEQPSDVLFAEHQSAESLAVEWTRPRCGETGYIEYFIVAACRLDDDNCDCRRGDGDFSYQYSVSVNIG